MSTSTAKGSRIYYGEYSLEQWIKLILTGEIVLPPYQRAFVWTEEDVKDLINSLKEGLFVPPITIGNYGGKQNYILDGQQRLSTLLIAYLGLFPNKEKFQFQSPEYHDTANENDDIDDEKEDIMPFEWQFTYFTKEGQDKESILKKIDRKDEKYKEFVDKELDENFWRDSYIGFSLIIPNSAEVADQQKLYSSVFRNINIKGKSLSHIESRKSLYFLRESFDQWFSPQFAYGITVNNAPIDFVRYLSLVSQYKKNESTGRLAQNYKTRMEKYYESYILAEVNNEDSTMFRRLLDSDDTQRRFQILKKCLESERYQRAFPSIIDADVYLFGLIYYIIVEGKTISVTESLFSELDEKVANFRGDSKHTKSPSSFMHLRPRVKASIDTYYTFIDPTNSDDEA
jgi:hypothetical protein BACCOPRO_01637